MLNLSIKIYVFIYFQDYEQFVTHFLTSSILYETVAAVQKKRLSTTRKKG